MSEHYTSKTGNRMMLSGTLISLLGMALYLLASMPALAHHSAIEGTSLILLGGGVIAWFVGAYRCLKVI